MARLPDCKLQQKDFTKLKKYVVIRVGVGLGASFIQEVVVSSYPRGGCVKLSEVEDSWKKYKETKRQNKIDEDVAWKEWKLLATEGLS